MVHKSVLLLFIITRVFLWDFCTSVSMEIGINTLLNSCKIINSSLSYLQLQL